MSDEKPRRECVIHAVSTDPDCEYCTAEIQDLSKMYSSKVQGNQSKMQALAATGIQLDPAGMHLLRLNLLITVLLGDENKQRLKFECDFQDNLRVSIESIQSQVRKQQLLQGVTPPRGINRITPK